MRPTDLSLLEQMNMTELEIDQRLELFNVSNDDAQTLKQFRPLLEHSVDVLVEEFYDTQTQIPDVAQLIGDSGTLERLHASQRKYILDLFSGLYDIEYANQRLRIGLVHKRAGVDPKLYLSSIHCLKNILTGFLQLHIQDKEHCVKTVDALEKLIMFDISLVFDAFIRNMLGEIETAKTKSDNYARSLEQKIRERTQQLDQLSKTDGLTGLYNVRYLKDTLIHGLRSAERRSRSLSLVYIDLNDLKLVNDTEGHIRGDEIISKFAKAIQEVAREEDWCFRYGGDEFCVLLHDCTEEDAWAVYNDRLRRELEKTLPGVNYSLGVAQAGPTDYPNAEQLIRYADQRMYEMKQQQKAAQKQKEPSV